MSNYDKLFREKENNIPLANTDMEKNWAAMETQLNSGSQSTSKDAGFNFKIILKGLLITGVVGIIAFVIFTTTRNKNKAIPNRDLSILKSAIKPPMPSINIPYETFMYKAEIGDTLFTRNGSIIIFPKNAVVNNKGEVVMGIIEIRVREFNDPLDYYMAGIPMTYDSAGVKYTFISSAMIDIKAYQKNELLFVNPNAKPQLNLVSTNKEINTNLYVLDSTTGEWINKGKDEVNDMAKTSQHNFNSILVKGDKLKEDSENGNFLEELNKNNISFIKPIPPQKANGKNPTIEILIDPASFKELLAYNNMKFEVLNNATEIVGEDSKTEWDNVELLHHGDGSNYIAKFSKGNKSVQYKVRPVLEGKDYDVAVNVYNGKIKSYNEAQKNRLADEQIQTAKLVLEEKTIDDENKKTEANNEIVNAKNKITEIENKQIEELNVLIIARNKKVAEDKKLYQSEMKRQQKINDSIQILWEGNREVLIAEIKKQKKISDSLRVIWENNNRALVISDNLIRSFEINSFGYWNCDQPTLPNFNPINATFLNNNNEILTFSSINVALIGMNRLFVFNNNKISVLKNANQVLWAVFENQFYFFTASDYNKLLITKPNNATFIMKKYEGQPNGVQELRKVLYGG